MNDTALELHAVAKRFGSQQVLVDESFRVERGRTFAVLGRNGAGKTTTIQMMLGLLAPDAGEIRVLGLDPARSAVELRRRVGYLAEDQRMFGWMKVQELLRFTAAFYPTWDAALAKDLAGRFELSATVRVKHLSKGQGVRLGLLLALAHRPELVILDDPTLGLDPIMRKEFLRDVVTHLQGRGATVFFSSHLLYEIEPVADEVAILEGGRIVRQMETEALRGHVKRLILATADYERLAPLPGMLGEQRRGGQVAVTVEDPARALQVAAAAGLQPQVVDLNLDEIFEAYCLNTKGCQHDPTTPLERVA
jgi:ABC-2 type transport system ATP-binding protein